MRNELQRPYSEYCPAYIRTVEDLAAYFRQSPEQLGPAHVRDYRVFEKRNLFYSRQQRKRKPLSLTQRSIGRLRVLLDHRGDAL